MFIRAQVVEHTQSPFDFGFPQQQRGEATGSGFVVDRNGTILTNAHVVAGATKVTVQFADKHVVDGEDPRPRRVDRPRGAEGQGEGERADPLALGSANGVQVGDPTIAIGNPFGLERTLTTGVVSAPAPRSRRPTASRSTASSRPTRRSTPATRAARCSTPTGRVIGINSQIETGGSGGGNVGIGFAIPIDTAKRLLPELEKNGRVDRGFLGVDALDHRLLAQRPQPPGRAAACSSRPSRPAARRRRPASRAATSSRRSTATRSASAATSSPRSTARASARATTSPTRSRARKKGDKVKIDVVRDGKKRTVTVTLARPPDADHPGPDSPYDGGVQPPRPPRIKFCGITGLDDAKHAVEAGAWALGLILFAGSPRRCALPDAERIAATPAPPGRDLRRVRQRAARRGHRRPPTGSG